MLQTQVTFNEDWKFGSNERAVHGSSGNITQHSTNLQKFNAGQGDCSHSQNQIQDEAN
jgi:hypothetical protein